MQHGFTSQHWMLLALAWTLAGCGQSGLTGTVKIDGSSTVYLLSSAVAEEFRDAQPSINATVGVSGTGGGFKKFYAGEIDICDASRRIKDSEIEECKKHNIEYVELVVAYDGLAVLVNPANTWVDTITVEELKAMWGPDSKAKTWKDVNPEWPDEPLKLYGPGTDSGTFDYFTEKINGKEKACRKDFTASEDDNVLVTGIAADKHALGYFGFAYYEENKEKLKLLAVDGGKGGQKPSHETVRSGVYAPLSRPLYIYVKRSSLERPEVAAFLRFYLEHGGHLASEVGYVETTADETKKSKDLLEAELAALKK